MGVPALVAGAGLASRGLASYLAKNKAKKEMMKAGYGATRNASIPSLVSTQGSPGVFAKRLGLMGLATGAGIYGADSLINHPRNEAMNKMRGGDYIASPMMGKSHDPSYEASLTREGQVQTMMEEMDGMDISEEGKRRIIQDKLWRKYDQYGNETATNLTGYEWTGPGNAVHGPETGVSMTSNEMKASYFDRIASNPNLPMDQRITAALRRETGAAFSTEEAIEMIQKLEARDKQALINQTGAATTREELDMFMGMPRGR
jgi:hypothetical protein